MGGQGSGIVRSFLGLQSPNGLFIALLVTRKELADADWRAGLKNAIHGDQSGKAARGIRSTAESEDEYFIAVSVIFNQPLIRETDILIDALPENATPKAVNTDR